MFGNHVLYSAYEKQLVRGLAPERMPRHVGVMLDGNRRWAKARGANTETGHRAGADNIEPLLTWCEELGIEIVTLWLLSTDNLKRPENELAPLLEIIEDVVADLASKKRWKLNLVGTRSLLPQRTRERLEEATADTSVMTGCAPDEPDAHRGLIVNVAVGYGGRQEIADAVRAMLLDAASAGETLESFAEKLTVDDIAAHLYTKGQPDPDLVIRTSGEQRIGGFLLWQSAHSEFYFCEAFWPDFRRVDFLRAVRAYAERERRFGS